MDEISYTYDNTAHNNKLKDYTETAAHVNGTNFENDLQVHNPLNPVERFKYDAIGNLVKDLTNPNPHSISDIYWTLYGKVAKIDYTGQNSYTLFGYEPGGNRFKKTTIKPLSAQSSTQLHLNEYYIRDASGNILAIYRQRKELDMVKPYEDLLNEIKTLPSFSAALAQVLNGNDEFVGHLSEELLNEQPAFLANLTDAKTASYYLKNSPAAKLSMIRHTPQLVMDLYNTTPDSVYAVLPPSASEVFGILLHEQNDSIKKMYIGHLADENDPDLYQLYKDYFALEDDMMEMESFKEVMYRALGELDIDVAYVALSDFWSQQTLERWHGLLHRLLNDTDYMNTDNLSYSYKTMHNFVQNRLGMYGDTKLLGDYFDAMNPTTATAILHSVTSKPERAQIVYATEPEAMLDAMKGQAWFGSLMENAMKATTSISFTDMAYKLSQSTLIGLPVSMWLLPALREDHYYLAEHHLYGSSRLGIKNYWSNHYSFHYDYDAINNSMTWAQALEANQLLSFKRPWYSQQVEGLIQANETIPYGHANTNQVLSARQLGLKQYELTNHLGNVMAVVTDKLVDSVAGGNTVTDPLGVPSIRNAWASASYDYYPFGMLMPERYTEDKTEMCAPVSTAVYYPQVIDLLTIAMEQPTDVSFFTTPNTMDVLEVKTQLMKLVAQASPTGEEHELSTELTSGIEAGKLMNVTFALNNEANEFVSVQVQQQNANSEWETLASTTVAHEAEVNLDFTPSNTSALKLLIKGVDLNIRVGGIRIKRVDLFGTTVVSTICNTGDFENDYRFGFGGKEKDNEIKGIGNSLDFGARIYDSRLGRWLSTDPKYQFVGSQYSSFANNPILLSDPDGGWVLKVANGNMYLVAEKGDNQASLAKFFNSQSSQAHYNPQKPALGKSTSNDVVKFVKENVLVLNSNTTASKAYNDANSNKDNYKNESDGFLNKLEKALTFSKDENYNCHAFSEAISTGSNLNYKSGFSQQAGFLSAQTFNQSSGTYTDNYNNDNSSDQFKNSVFGESVIAFTDDKGGITHTAVFAGTSKDGTNYYMTKNGGESPPQVLSLGELEKTYGNKHSTYHKNTKDNSQTK